MEKYKRLNEDLLNDEEHPELIDLMKAVANDLTETTQRFKAIAKAKGQRYNIATKMKDAIVKKIYTKDPGTMTGSQETVNASSLESARLPYDHSGSVIAGLVNLAAAITVDNNTPEPNPLLSARSKDKSVSFE